MNKVPRKSLSFLCIAVLAGAAFAAPLGSSVRPAIPAEVQQIICVDYRALKNSDTAQQLKEQVLPENLKQFETALKGAGIDPDRDVDQLTFISYRHPKQGLEVVGAAQGVFANKAVLRKLRLGLACWSHVTTTFRMRWPPYNHASVLKDARASGTLLKKLRMIPS